MSKKALIKCLREKVLCLISPYREISKRVLIIFFQWPNLMLLISSASTLVLVDSNAINVRRK